LPQGGQRSFTVVRPFKLYSRRKLLSKTAAPIAKKTYKTTLSLIFMFIFIRHASPRFYRFLPVPASFYPTNAGIARLLTAAFCFLLRPQPWR